jgi:MFS family permease
VTYLVGVTGLMLGLSRGGLDGWTDPFVLVGFAAAIVLLPLFALVERRVRAPMLDLAIFRDRLFAAASASSPYWVAALWLALVGAGCGVFNSPNTSAMMGVVPKNRRGVAAGTRTMLQNTGAVISISFVLAIVTAGIPKDVLFRIFSGLATRLAQDQVNLFIGNLHEAVLVLAAFSLLGALVSLLRPSHRAEAAA